MSKWREEYENLKVSEEFWKPKAQFNFMKNKLDEYEAKIEELEVEVKRQNDFINEFIGTEHERTP